MRLQLTLLLFLLSVLWFSFCKRERDGDNTRNVENTCNLLLCKVETYSDPLHSIAKYRHILEYRRGVGKQCQ